MNLKKGVKSNIRADDINRIIYLESISERLNIKAERISVEDFSGLSVSEDDNFNDYFEDNISMIEQSMYSLKSSKKSS